MTDSTPPPDFEELTSGRNLRLQDLANRSTLGDLARSLHRLTGVPLRLFDVDGTLLADAAEEQPLCRYLNTLPAGRTSCARTVSLVKKTTPAAQAEALPCFSGASYHIVNLEYDHRRIGRVVLGPFLRSPASELPASLLDVDPALDRATTGQLFAQMPRLAPAQLDHLEAHLRATLDLILFAGHKALLTSEMHLASVRASYHDLQDRNEKLQQALDKLRELDRLKSNFLATISHELRTPLTSIIGYSEMLAEGIAGNLSGDQLEYVQTIHEKGEQLLQLIMNLLDLSKLESGTMSVRRGPIHIDQVLRQVASTLLPAARKKSVNLETFVPSDLPDVHGDAERLRQVFLNLTENALKFTPPGGTIRLSATPARPDDLDDSGFVLLAPAASKVEVRVADSGVGIPEKERGKVFDAFYQIDSSSTREHGGAGLGLSIVKRLVEAHNGTIHIENNVPRGTVIVVTLPTVAF